MSKQKSHYRADHQAYHAFANRKAEIYLYGMHTATVGRGWFCRRHLHHRMLEVNLVMQGVQTVIAGDERWLQRQGELLLIPPMREHGFEMQHSGELQYFVLHIQVADATFMQLLQRMKPLHISAEHPLHAQLLPMVEEMLQRLQSDEGATIPVLSLAYGLLYAIENGLRSELLPSDDQVFNTAAAIALAIERLLLQDNAAEAVVRDESDGARRNWLNRIAAKLGMSSRHCSRIFHQAYGMTPRHYYAMLRQQEALHLLMNTDDTLSAIADRIGFENVQSFIRQFVKWTGETPGRYRQRTEGKFIYLTPLEVQ